MRRWSRSALGFPECSPGCHRPGCTLAWPTAVHVLQPAEGLCIALAVSKARQLTDFALPSSVFCGCTVLGALKSFKGWVCYTPWSPPQLRDSRAWQRLRLTTCAPRLARRLSAPSTAAAMHAGGPSEPMSISRLHRCHTSSMSLMIVGFPPFANSDPGSRSRHRQCASAP